MTHCQHDWETPSPNSEQPAQQFFSNNGNAITVPETCKRCGNNRWAYYRRDNSHKAYRLAVQAPNLWELTKLVIGKEMPELRPADGPSLQPTAGQADPDRFPKATPFDPRYI